MWVFKNHFLRRFFPPLLSFLHFICPSETTTTYYCYPSSPSCLTSSPSHPVPPVAIQSFTWFTWTTACFTFTSSLDTFIHSHSTQPNISHDQELGEGKGAHARTVLLPLLLSFPPFRAYLHDGESFSYTRYIAQNMKLSAVIDIMIKNYGFQASYAPPLPPERTKQAIQRASI